MSDVLSLTAPQAEPTRVLTPDDYSAAASLLHCEPAAIRAVAEVETGVRGPFDSQGRPTILYERHLFHRATHGKYDGDASGISNPQPGGYGLYTDQYRRLLLAAALDLDAALASTSWGAFQILGMYHAAAGFANVQDFVIAMRSGVRAHLLAFSSFVTANPAMLRAIRAKDWTALARAYNGAAEAEHQYDARLAEAYKRASLK